MPAIARSSFAPFPLFAQCDVQTVLSSTLRNVERPTYRRERIQTPDSDFFDIDLVENGSDRLALICHGLEGSSKSSYMRGMVRALSRAGFDVAAKNFRGCSGEPNTQPYSYHSGSSNDVATAVEYFKDRYQRISLIGFSLGGNVVLKYLGEMGADLPSCIDRSVAFSVPIDLESCAYRLALRRNKVYMNRFLRMLREKMTQKAELFPELVTLDGYEQLKSFADFDGRYIAPLNGFKDAKDYWTKSSSLPLLHRISSPTLLVNALDDPFLTPECFPEGIAEKSKDFFLEAPSRGGHVGFFHLPWQKSYWSEQRAIEFLSQR